MSLVLEALRRVEKPAAGAGSVGATVASYRPARRSGAFWLPLVLGLGTGGLAIVLFGPAARTPDVVAPAAEVGRTPKGRAGLPPPRFPQPGEPPAGGARIAAVASPVLETGAAPRVASAAGPRSVAASKEIKIAPVLVLQAISQRDSHPIAIINDQLVKEGDLLGTARVVAIGPDSVDVLLDNGRRDTVRFAPLPPPDSSPSPESR